MNPDEMTDEQVMRTVTVAIAAVSGTASTIVGVIDNSEILARYINTGVRPQQEAPKDWGRSVPGGTDRMDS